MLGALLADGAQQQAGEAAAPAGADNEQLRLLGGLDQHDRGRSFERDELELDVEARPVVDLGDEAVDQLLRGTTEHFGVEQLRRDVAAPADPRRVPRVDDS
jgi:hypothetical protein